MRAGASTTNGGGPESNDDRPKDAIGNGHADGTTHEKAPDGVSSSPHHETHARSVNGDHGGETAADGGVHQDSHVSTEGTDEEEEEDDSEDEDEEDEEPTLKYERMGGDFPTVLENDSASAIAISSKLMASYSPHTLLCRMLNRCLSLQALGTHKGIVHVFSIDGTKVKSYRAHTASVNCVVLDVQSEYVATAAMDGQ